MPPVVVAVLVLRGRTTSRSDELPSRLLHLECAVRDWLMPTSRQSVVHVVWIQTFESINDGVRTIPESATHIAVIAAGAFETRERKWNLVMDHEDGCDDVDLCGVVARIKETFTRATQIVAVVDACDSSGEPTMTQANSLSLCSSLCRAGCSCTVVSFAQPLPKSPYGFDTVFRRKLHNMMHNSDTKLDAQVLGEWPRDAGSFRTPPRPSEEDEEVHAFRSSCVTDKEVCPESKKPLEQATAPHHSIFEEVEAPRTVPSARVDVSRDIISQLPPSALKPYEVGIISVKSQQPIAVTLPNRELSKTEYWCSKCELVVNGLQNWKQHCRSVSHLRRENLNMLVVYYCSTCETEINGESNLDQHLRGMKHAKRSEAVVRQCKKCKQSVEGDLSWIHHQTRCFGS